MKMKDTLNWWLLLLSMAFVAACSDGGEDIEEPAPKPTPSQPAITLDVSSADFTTDGGSNTISFTTSEPWTAEVLNSRADAWCSVSPTNGKAGDAEITVTTTPNDTPDNRSASIILKAGSTQKTITVSQKQKDALTVTSDKFEVSAEGGEVTIEVKANIDFEYSISEKAKAWITFADSRALKTSTLVFNVSENEDVEKREGSITITSGAFKETVTVYQEGTEPVITLTQNEFVVPSAGDVIAVEVKSNVDVEVELPAEAGWLSEDKSRAMSTNTYYFIIAESQEYDQREAFIKFTNKKNELSETVKVVQVQKDAIVVAKNEYEMDVEGGALDFEILTNVDVTVTIPDSVADWISHVESRALESKTLHFDIAPCQSDERIGIITLTGGDAIQIITIKQNGKKDVNPEDIPDNEIWYKTSNEDIVWGLSNNAFDKEIISNTYSGGKGVIKLSGKLNIVRSLAFDNSLNLKYLILPNTVESIEDQAFVGGDLDSLYIPSNLKNISGYAFAGCKVGRFIGDSRVQGNGSLLVIGDTLKVVSSIKESELIIPGTIRVIGSHALWLDNPNITKIVIEEGIEVIEPYAFSGCKSLEYVYLPNSLDDLQNSVFDYCDNIRQFYGPAKYVSNDGRTTYRYVPYNCGTNIIDLKFISNIAKADLTNYTIDDDIGGVDPEAFCRAYNLQNLTINSKTIFIDGDTFDECYNLEHIMGPGATPDGRGYVGSGSFGMECSLANAKLLVFAGKGISEYEVGDYCREIGSGVFAYQQDLKTIKINDNVTKLGNTVFWGCQNLEEVTLPAHLQYIGIHAFMECPNLKAVYSRSPIPPILEKYGTDVDDIFDLGSNLGNLKIYVPENSVDLYKTTYPWSRYSNYIIGYNPNYDHYISSDNSSDGKTTTLQTATKGNGIDIVLMGDGYSDRQIADGTYKADMENLYNNLFTEEPYKSFKDHFNVYYVNVVSATEGYEYGNTALEGFFGDGTLAGGSDNAAFTYALKAISEERMNEALLIVAMNSDNYAGTCYMYQPEMGSDYGSGPSVSYFPRGGDAETFAQLLHHEACGHGFAKLADEYAYEEYGAISVDEINAIKEQQNYWGWWKNVDFTNDLSQIRWSKFINDSRYANEGLGAYEGGLTYWTGVWRPTENSIMRYNTGGFNAPSREAIYYRIHKLAYGADWQYDYEKFVEWDAINRNSTTARSLNHVEVPKKFKPLHAPVVKRQTWKDAK